MEAALHFFWIELGPQCIEIGPKGIGPGPICTLERPSVYLLFFLSNTQESCVLVIATIKE